MWALQGFFFCHVAIKEPLKVLLKKLTLLDLYFRTITSAFRPEGAEIGNKETNCKSITYSSSKKY